MTWARGGHDREGARGPKKKKKRERDKTRQIGATEARPMNDRSSAYIHTRTHRERINDQLGSERASSAMEVREADVVFLSGEENMEMEKEATSGSHDPNKTSPIPQKWICHSQYHRGYLPS
jgi:hypothetical protein